MATDIMAFVQFSDGTFGSFLKEGATAEAVTSLPTGGVGLNQVSGVEIGQAYAGKTAIAAAVRVATDSAQTGAFQYAYFLGADGKIISPIQGGGFRATGLPRLKKPVRMAPGITLQAAFDATTDAVSLAALACYCSDGTSDVFFVKSVSGTKTPMVNKDGSSIGQALNGKVLSCVYATYSATNGLNDNGTGVGAFFVEASDGQLKAMFPPTNGSIGEEIVPYMDSFVPVRIVQNDTLSVTAGV